MIYLSRMLLVLIINSFLLFATGDGASEICQLPKVVGPCQAALPHFYYNSESRQCEEFLYGGCSGNANNFESVLECEQTCDECDKGCTRESDPQCGSDDRTYSNPCTFGVAICQHGDKQPALTKACAGSCPCRVCQLPYQVGPCRAALPRFYYNSVSGQCEKFTYGGCGGNGNRFENLHECLQTCGNLQIGASKSSSNVLSGTVHVTLMAALVVWIL